MWFSVKAIPSKSVVVVNALSCNPIAGPEVSDTKEDGQANLEAVIQIRPMSENKVNLICESTSNDPIMRNVTRFIKEGWPHHVTSEL